MSNPERVADLKLARTVVSALKVRDRQLPEIELQHLISQTFALAQIDVPSQSSRSMVRSIWRQSLGWTAFALMVSGLAGWLGNTLLSSKKPVPD